MYHSISALYGYSLCCITLTPGPPYSQSGGVEGWRAPKEREQVSKELTTAPPSFQLHPPPPLLFIPSFSLSLPSIQPSALIGRIMMAISPAPLSKPVQLYAHPSPAPGTPPLRAFANFLLSPCSSPQQHYNPPPTPPHPRRKSLTPDTGSGAKTSGKSGGEYGSCDKECKSNYAI